MSYHAASGNIAVGHDGGYVQIASLCSPGVHTCVPVELEKAKKQAMYFKTSLDKADDGLRQEMSREHELTLSIADLLAERAHI